MSAAITVATRPEANETRFSEEQRNLILDTCCGGASPKDAAVLIAIAEQRGLNPILGECYFVERYDSAKGRKIWAVQVSIDAIRIKADETGRYDGQDEPEYEYDPKTGALLLARVTVWRKGWSRPAVGVARFDEYVQRTKDGAPTKFWRTMPHNQLAKCAEALAMRKAFPKLFARIYTPDEMGQAENPEPVTVAHDHETGELPHHPPTTPAPPPVFDVVGQMPAGASLTQAPVSTITYEPAWYLDKHREAYNAATTLEQYNEAGRQANIDAKAGHLDPAHVALLKTIAARRKAAIAEAAAPRDEEPWDAQEPPL